MSADLPARRHPCADCPWRRDAPVGQWSMERFQNLAATSGTPGAEIAYGGPMFACHKSVAGRDQACAGWLATVGGEHIGVRIAVAQGRLDPAALSPGEGWPELHPTYADMVARQAVADPQVPAARPDLADEVLQVIREATPIKRSAASSAPPSGWCLKVRDDGAKCIDVLAMLSNFRVVLSDREHGREHITYTRGWCYYGHGDFADGRPRTMATAQAAAFLAAAAWDGYGEPAGYDKIAGT